MASSAAAMAEQACRPDLASLRGSWGQAAFTVEIADDGRERAQGLMYRDQLDPWSGMLFVYERPSDTIAFWMRNTRIPLDIIFLDQNGVVRRIAENAVPFDETGLPGGNGIQYVLEINGGMARRLGIGVGTELRNPVLGEFAAWPC
ncbi:DUF192 domain-containing protein [Pseudooceanicola sp. C21-150M6]|uniref:DUF192 domain-containing protein n=1 Tax=Pseudooceanicola sp. C21-150M6 TaxID=3434355 RepID=UPI003D7FE9BD